MGLEATTYINGLVVTNPISSDKRSQGDDHLRLLKATLKNTLPNASRPFRFPASVDTQTDDYVVHESSSDGTIVPINARAAAKSVTLPLAPAFDGLRLTVVKADHSLNTVTISGNGNLINGQSSLELGQRYQKARLVWCAASGEWFAEVEQLPPTGSWLFHSGDTAPPGYLIASEKTIGNGASAATARANEDCLALYQLLYAKYDNTICPVSGGRGANALADFDAGKTLKLLDARGRFLFSRDNAGGTAAGRVTSGTGGIDGTALGVTGGADKTTLLQANLPNVNLSSSGLSASTTVTPNSAIAQRVSSFFNVGGAASTRLIDGDPAAVSLSATTTISGTIPLGGSATPMTNLPPCMGQLLCIKY